MKNKIAVIIVTFNGSKWIQKCLNSILNSSCTCEIFVVDNASTDDSVTILKNFPTINLIEAKINLGFGKANNIGIKKALIAGFDTFFLLNQDTWVFENTISNLVFQLNDNPKFGILSPLHFAGNGINLDENFANYYRKNNIVNSSLNIKNVDFVNAAAWMVSKDCFIKIGFFDPIFNHYGEDRNFCNRVLFHKFEIGIIESAKICHDRIITRNFEKDILQSKFLILNNLININNSLFCGFFEGLKQVFGLPKYFRNVYGVHKSVILLIDLLVYYLQQIGNIKTMVQIRKASKEGTNGID